MAKDKKRDGKKSEKSVPPVPAHSAAAESSPTKLTALHASADGTEEAQASAAVLDKEPEKAEEAPIQDIPPYYEEPILAQLVVKSYEGDKVRRLYEGEGVAFFEGGNIYKGMFSEGLMHGQGTYTWADGVKYEGTFVKNVQMVNGCYMWNDGSIYEGSIKNGLRHGFGFFRSGIHPVSYVGYWYKGKRHGKGTIYYDQEHMSWYSGDWVDNVKEGWGIRCYKSGNIYEGHWEKNARHGRGRMRWLTAGQEYVGQWVHGVQHGYGTHIWFLKRMPASQYPQSNKYVGEFVNGQRHGQGKFIYASGAVYEGQWVHDKKHGKLDAESAPKLDAVCSGSCSGSEAIRIINNSENPSALGSDIELDISSVLNLLPREERQEEVKQVEFAVLRHITKLRRVYTFYSSLGCDDSPDNTFLMTRLQFWRFLKDCCFHHSSLTLAEMDRILSGDKTPLEEIHSPYETLLFRTFLSHLIHLSFHIYHEEHKGKSPYLHKCFIEMMSRNVNPTACHIQGLLFSEQRRAVFAMRYIDKCWEIHRAFCRQNTRPPFEPTMKMRQFLWMLNLVFLEFVEALLHCALVYVTNGVIKEQVDDQKSNFRTEGFSEGTTNETCYTQFSLSQVLRPCEDRGHSRQEFLMDELEAQTGKDKEFDWWMYQVQIFFTNKLFPAYQHEKVLKAKIKENRIRSAELAELRRRKDEEIAKLIAEREAEDAKKQKGAAEEEMSLESKSTVFKELEEPGAQSAPPPKEEASAVPAPAVTKVPTGTKKRRK